MAATDKADPGKGQTLPWLLLSGILGMFAAGAPLPTGGPKDPPKAAGKADPAADQRARVPANPLLKPIEEFHASRADGWTPADLARDAHGYRTEFLIATVPDPIDSPYGYAFDQVVDAIQRGVQQKDGYLLDRAWLPWEADRKPRPAAGPPPAPAPTPGDCRETTPGVLVFRHGRDAGKGVHRPGLCVVFLVGETPLGGIHKKAFWECLKLIAASGQAAEPVRVVGPYFTGSQTSLQFLIDDWMRAGPPGSAAAGPRPNRFRILTGNASGMRTKEFFKDAWGPDRVEVAATVAPARVQLNAVLHFLAGRDGARAADPVPADASPRLPGRVAILTESNTGFGKHVAAYGANAEVVVLRFPLHVSRLKSEYAQAFRKRDEQAGLKQAAPVAADGFEDAGGAGEGVPSQGGAPTTAANNAVLATILSTISRERFRYVGVVATDARDKLFLTRLVREFCPDVHVFLTQADLLLTHPDYLYHMKGVVVGSTYPLYAPNQRWVNPDTPELQLLASSAAQGYYNATVALIGAADQMLEYAPPGFAAGPGVPADRPPVWVSMVAPSGSLVPLQVFTGYEDPGGYVWRKPGGFPAPPPTGLRYPAAAYLAGTVLAAFWAWLVATLWRGRGVWAAGGGGQSPAVGVYRTVLLGAQMVLAAAVAAVTTARLEQYGADSLEDLAVLAAAALGWVLFLGLAVRGVSLRRPADGPAGRRWRWNLVHLAVVLGLVAFTAVFLGRFWVHADRPYRALFFVRAVDLGTGLSPLTPLVLMCAAITAGAYFQVERHDLARRSRVPSPFPSGAEGLFDRLGDEDRRLTVEMSPGRFWRRHRVAVTALFAGLLAAGVTVWRQSLPTVEGPVWDAAFAVGFWAIYAFAALTLLQLLLLWRQTRQLLAVVAQLPMMRVFARLPAKVSAVVTRHLYTRTTQPLLLQMTTHQLRLLAAAAADDPAAPGPVRDLGPLADEAEARLRAAANPPRGTAGDPADEAALRGVLSDGAARALKALAPRWQSLPTDEAFGGSPAAAGAGAAEAAAEPAWVGRAEELAATQLVNYLSQYFIQLRSLMLSALVCSSLLLLAATCYPFHPERLLLVFLLGLVGAGVAAVMYVFVDMSRDETVSRVARTTPGRLSLDSGVLGPLVTYVLPTLGILTAQLSGTFRWALEPILRVVK